MTAIHSLTVSFLKVYHIEDVIEEMQYVVDDDSPYVLRQSQLVQVHIATSECYSNYSDTDCIYALLFQCSQPICRMI